MEEDNNVKDNIEWLYNLKMGDKVIVKCSWGWGEHYRVGTVNEVKEKKGKIVISVKYGDKFCYKFIDGKRKADRWSQEVLYEYNDFNYQKFIAEPSAIKKLNDFEFRKLLKNEKGKVLLLEIYSKLKKEGWL